MRVLAVSQQDDAGPGVFAEAITGGGHELTVWEPARLPEPAEDPLGFDATIVLGGAMNVDQVGEHPWLGGELEVIRSLLAARRPVLGVCLGSQLLATAAGGGARRASEPEIGWFDVELTHDGAADPLMGPLAPSFEALQWHSYECVLPPGAVELARSPVCPQAFRLQGPAWGIQFHPETSRADALHWIDDSDSDPDAVRIGIDPERFRAATEPRLAAWNELGREFCRRFLLEAERYSGVT